MNRIIIFTDGSSRGNPGPGGWAAVIVASCELLGVREEKETDGVCIIELGGREEHTTNNRMELQAIIGALSFVQHLTARGLSARDADLLVGMNFQLQAYLDSNYVINGITKWVFGWQKNGWKTGTKEDVVNRDLWKKLIELTKGKNIKWNYVGGHVGIAGNERCDEIATAFADGESPKLFKGAISDYKIDILNTTSMEGTAKKSGSKHSKSKAYSYVSSVDGEIQTHATWVECEARVKGKSGAKFKKALSREDEALIIQSFQ